MCTAVWVDRHFVSFFIFFVHPYNLHGSMRGSQHMYARQICLCACPRVTGNLGSIPESEPEETATTTCPPVIFACPPVIFACPHVKFACVHILRLSCPYTHTCLDSRTGLLRRLCTPHHSLVECLVLPGKRVGSSTADASLITRGCQMPRRGW